jgi:hypothetical protein
LESKVITRRILTACLPVATYGRDNRLSARPDDRYADATASPFREKSITLNRRESFKSDTMLLAGRAVVPCGGSNAAASDRKKFLLVNGAWHSSLHWNRMAALLSGTSHIVHTSICQARA